jgi:hypothetical protein
VRTSADQPSWIPFDAGLVDHLFLLFGLVESLDPNFFASRVFPALSPGDFNADGIVNAQDYSAWRATYGSTALSQLAADGSANGLIDSADYVLWRKSLSSESATLALSIPEPSTAAMLFTLTIFCLTARRRPRFS